MQVELRDHVTRSKATSSKATGCGFSNILLFQDIIYNVKSAFNKEFNAAFTQKELEIIRVKERNVRIQEIILDLELDESVWTPTFDDTEKPERILVVDNSEVMVTCVIPSLETFSLECLIIHLG